MTREELLALTPKETMVYRKSDGVGYTFMGIDEDGKYMLSGMPSYEDYLMMSCFELRENA